MDCGEVRLHLLDDHRGRLERGQHEDIRAHIQGCAACARAEAAELALTEALEQRLPQHPATLALKRRLAAEWPVAAPRRQPWWSRWRPALLPALAVAGVVIVALPVLYYQRASSRPAAAAMVAEAVNDHLRVLQRPGPLDVEGGGVHQVKPWFAGRLDFAPVVAFGGDGDYPLRGGAIGYFLDRRAAVFVYTRRLHTVSLLVFRADGLPWPARELTPLGTVRAYTTVARGFNVVMWRAGELGYALVSDLDARELRELALKVSGGS
jgi:anti-sigma factor RsiW